MAKTSCSVPDCAHDSFARGWCRTHYNRRHKFGDVRADQPVRRRLEGPEPGELCEITGCGRPMEHRPWCVSHHKRWKQFGDPEGGRPIKARGGPMGSVPCAIEGCRSPSRTRGWCHAHYRRWRKTGDPAARIALRSYGETVEARFWANVDKHGPTPAHRPDLGPCHLWTRPLNTSGYGIMNVGGRRIGVHHLGWTIAGGPPIAAGMQPDHLCGVRNCVRREHLEPVPRLINLHRSNSAGARNARKTECLNGHPFDEANTYRDSHGRRCRKCACIRERTRRQARASDSGSSRPTRARHALGEVVYFVERDGFIKIGTTTRLARRLSQIPREHWQINEITPGPVRLLASIPGGRQQERELHRQFRHLRVAGEWFRSDDELQATIARL